VEIVCRDRHGLYVERAREGAPQARHVADRFHLAQNLRDRSSNIWAVGAGGPLTQSKYRRTEQTGRTLIALTG
jgi:Transposase